MDKKKSLLNIFVSLSFKIITLFLALLSRRFLWKYASGDANGLFTLYTSIISFVVLADLGVGTAITFSMYKPIVQGDNQKVVALYQIYKKICIIIGLIVLAIGLVIMPLLPFLAKGYSTNNNLYLTFFIMLGSVALSYIYSAKSTLIVAHKNNYITVTINSISTITKQIFQIVVLKLTGSFELFLMSLLLATCIEWIITEIITRKKYGEIITSPHIALDKATKNQIFKNTKAVFMQKLGGELANATDSIIISSFIGVTILGQYANYIVIMSAMTGLLTLFFSPLTSVVGHLCAEKNPEEERKYFWFMYLLNFVLGVIFFLGYYAIIDNLIVIVFDKPDLVMGKSVSFIITLNYFIQFMLQAVGLFRDASGMFYYDRWRPIIEGIINIVLSLLLMQWIGLIGVIVATIVTNLIISHIICPLILYKHEFKRTPVRYYSINYGLIFVFAICLIALHFSLQHIDGRWLELLVNGCIAVAIALVPIIIIACVSKTFRSNTKELFKDLLTFFKFKKKDKGEQVNDVQTEQNLPVEEIVNTEPINESKE